ncbi:zinc finger protein 571-like [Culicoides brevitarsis]|uniref:zinc finger protein 571-like n=1 Tax=Culicoides brevitarsis TaxID=469753 RepID=UPI00307B88FA
MNFSAFGSPFSGFHQFSPKFEPQNGICSTFSEQDALINRYNMHSTSSNQGMQYSHNLPNYSSQEHHFMNQEVKSTKNYNKIEKERDEAFNQQLLQQWPLSSNEYPSHLLSATLPISIQHFLKYSETIKKESNNANNVNNGMNFGTDSNNFNVKVEGKQQQSQLSTFENVQVPSNNASTSLTNGNLGVVATPTATNANSTQAATTPGTKKKRTRKRKNKNNADPAVPAPPKEKKQRKKKPPKEKKARPKPGQIRETTALDGSKLFLCPECQMASPHRHMLEQHVVSHAIERRFVCDVCFAALKRKDHLTRHKLSHVPDRPHVCNICFKSFKRKEQLTLHHIIHSGEKKHVCGECGKGFYRKDHLRKHTRSHIARRVKSEMTTNNSATNGEAATTTAAASVASPGPVTAPAVRTTSANSNTS